MAKSILELTLNGQPRQDAVTDNTLLVDYLREIIGHTGAKLGCDGGECGACTVLVDGEPRLSCLSLATSCRGSAIETIEGVQSDDGLHPLQTAFVEKGAIQCGFCSSGMILSGKRLLEKKPSPSEAEIRTAISGNLCRCTGYQKIVEAIKSESSG